MDGVLNEKVEYLDIGIFSDPMGKTLKNLPQPRIM